MIAAKHLAAAALLSAAMAAGASASTIVTYSTSGTFSGSGTNVLSVSTSSLTGSGSASITFAGAPVGTTAMTEVDGAADLGAFTIQASATKGYTGPDLLGLLNGASFTLNLTQSDPLVVGPNSGSVTGSSSVTGHIQVTSVNSTYVLAIDFSGGSIVIPPGSDHRFVYTPDDFLVGGTIQADNKGQINYTQSQNLTGTVTEATVPLPASTWGGMGLLGLLGMARIRRRMNAAD